MAIDYRRYALLLLAAALGLYVLDFILQMLGFNLPPGMSIYLPPMFAAMVQGQSHIVQTERKPKRRELWAAAGPMTLWALAIQLILTAVIGTVVQMLGGVSLLAPLASLGGAIWAVIAAVSIILIYLFNVLGLHFGIKNALNAAKKSP